MANIKPKNKAKIVKGSTISYDPKTFKEHKRSNFFECSVETMYKKMKPFEYNGHKYIFIDTETYSVDIPSHELPSNIVRRWVGTGKKAVPQDFPFLFTLCDGVNAFAVFDYLDNNYENFKKLKEIFEDETIEKVLHNGNFDKHQFANIGLKIKGKIHETLAIAKLANENRHSYTLRDLAAKLPEGIVVFEDMVSMYKKTAKVTSYRQIPRELIIQYACADVWNCYQEFITEYPLIEKEADLLQLYETELEVCMVAWYMERKGMRLDINYEAPTRKYLEDKIKEAEESIYEEAGGLFNINSGKQLYDVLMRLGVNKEWIPIKQDTGNPVLDKFVMKDLAEKHKVNFVVKIQEFKKYEKLLGTYLNGIYSQHDAEDMVHCGINTMEAVTGRMSITKPALQTLPKKDKTIRNAFIPKQGHKFWFLDLDQVEYRMFAHYAQAVGLIEAIKKGYDIHQATAALIYKVPYEEVTEDMRTMAKRINFALIYGMGDPALAETLELSLGEAMKFKAQYFAALPEAQPFINSVQRVCKTRGWIKNKYGRRRRLKREEVYKAVNSLIQGCAADYIKEKAVLIMKYILLHKLPIDPVLPIHDEIIYDVPDGYDEEMYTIRWIQSEFTKFRAPITAGVEIASDRWGKKVEPDDAKFNALTDEQMEEVKNYNIYNGDIFDRCM